MNLLSFHSQEELLSFAAKDFIELGLKAISEKNAFFVALSGGNTAQEFYKELLKQEIPPSFFNNSYFFVSDDRAVSFDDPKSNAGNAWRLFLQPLGFSFSSLFPMYKENIKLNDAAKNYEQTIKNLLPHSSYDIPVFDVVYLGIGEDGHTASLFPYSELLADKKSLVTASMQMHNGSWRITFMPKLITAAKKVCLLVPGNSKQKIIEDIINGPLDTKKWPAQLIVRSGHPDISLLTT